MSRIRPLISRSWIEKRIRYIDRIYVFCAGQEEKCLNGDTYLSNKQHYVLVKKGDDTYKVPYPFNCDKTVEALNKKSEKEETLTAAQRLFFWTEYKKTVKLD